MLPELPEAALIAADAGFVGYDICALCWRAFRKCGFAGRLQCAIATQVGRKRLTAPSIFGLIVLRLWQTPLTLRLAQGGKHPVYLVISSSHDD